MKLYIIVQILLLSITLQAEINMKDASYKASFEDFPEVQRTYNSRSLYIGYFGFGWCSNLEKSLKINSPKEIAFKDCDKESPFVLMDENNSLKTRTYLNPNTHEKLVFKDGAYTHYLKTGEIRIYDRKGQMLNSIFPNGTKLGLLYNQQHLLVLKSSSGKTFEFTFNDTQQITQIMSGKTKALYLYEKSNLIQTVVNNKSHIYDYDELSNMTRITYPNQTEERILYNNDQDRVVKVELANQCSEYYDFQSSSDSLYQVSTLTRKCSDKVIHTFKYEFWYKSSIDGKYLDRYKIHQSSQTEKEQTLDITYHPTNGLPLKILKNGKELAKI